jgi:hypothetical protein
MPARQHRGEAIVDAWLRQKGSSYD